LLEDSVLKALEARVGRLHARQRLGIEKDHEAQVFGQGLNFFHIENLTSSHFLIEWILRLTGLYWRGRKNAERIVIRSNVIASEDLPKAFDGFTILHISDLHADMSEGAMANLGALLPEIAYDICVLTGDFRGKTFGPFEPSLARLRRLRAAMKGPVYAVLGNHDTIRMTPGLEAIDIPVLLNESLAIERGGERVHLVGVDDAHFYRADNLEKATANVPHDEFSILLSHTPEIYRQAAHADFNVLLAGHTHGGQICLPGGIPITLDSNLPRSMGSGAWTYGRLTGYTSVGAGSSVVPVRFNCPPEIALHRLETISEGLVKIDDREYPP
jgi:predicted MPP superfamily phosphohydrolase